MNSKYTQCLNNTCNATHNIMTYYSRIIIIIINIIIYIIYVLLVHIRTFHTVGILILEPYL